MWRKSTYYPLAEAVQSYRERDFKNLIRRLREYNLESFHVEDLLVDTEIDLRQMILDWSRPK